MEGLNQRIRRKLRNAFTLRGRKVPNERVYGTAELLCLTDKPYDKDNLRHYLTRTRTSVVVSCLNMWYAAGGVACGLPRRLESVYETITHAIGTETVARWSLPCGRFPADAVLPYKKM